LGQNNFSLSSFHCKIYLKKQLSIGQYRLDYNDDNLEI